VYPTAQETTDRLAVLLAEAGYSFYDGPDDIPFGEPQQRYWFCWTDGKCDVESGPDCVSMLGAVHSAMEHWFEHARIPTHHGPTNMPILDEETFTTALHQHLLGCGYTFHNREKNHPWESQAGTVDTVHWFVWEDAHRRAKGHEFDSFNECLNAAMAHWFHNSEMSDEFDGDPPEADDTLGWVPEVYGAIAEGEGWGIFNDGEIQRLDEAVQFDSDEGAVGHVQRLADLGSLLHQVAIASHARYLAAQAAINRASP
jgi:hypothetical protein